MPLARRYKSDIVLHTKRLTDTWYIDTMYKQVKSLDQNNKQLARVVFN